MNFTQRIKEKLKQLVRAEESLPIKQSDNICVGLRDCSAPPEAIPPVPDSPPDYNPTGSPCYCCGNTDYWKSKAGRVICRVCHPPAPGAEGGME